MFARSWICSDGRFASAAGLGDAAGIVAVVFGGDNVVGVTPVVASTMMSAASPHPWPILAGAQPAPGNGPAE